MVQAFKGWLDYEIGYRFIGTSADENLNRDLDKVACKDDRRVFFGQFDLVTTNSEKASKTLLRQLADRCSVDSTTDGGIARKREDGKWVLFDDESVSHTAAELIDMDIDLVFDTSVTEDQLRQSLLMREQG